jgi:hypothetical protein
MSKVIRGLNRTELCVPAAKGPLQASFGFGVHVAPMIGRGVALAGGEVVGPGVALGVTVGCAAQPARTKMVAAIAVR